MTKKLGVICGIGALILASTAYARTEKIVVVDDHVFSRCGDQQAEITGTVDREYRRDLTVTIDGEEVKVSTEGMLWSTGLISLGVGSHTVKAQVGGYDGDYYYSIDSDEKTLTIAQCQEEGGSVDEDRDQGPDPTPTPTPKVKKGKIAGVKAAVVKATPTPAPELKKLPSAGIDIFAPLYAMGSILTLGLAQWRDKAARR